MGCRTGAHEHHDNTRTWAGLAGFSRKASDTLVGWECFATHYSPVAFLILELGTAMMDCTPVGKRSQPAVDTPDKGVVWAEGVGGHDDREHARLCRRKGCPRCCWINNGKSWRASVGPWLAARVNDKERRWGIGCTWCAEAATAGMDDVVALGLPSCAKSPFVTFSVTSTSSTKVKAQRLKQHESSPFHLAVAAFAKSGTVPLDDAAPTVDEFDQVYKETMKGNGSSCVLFGQRKVRRMLWCLAETRRTLYRDALKKAVTICLSQDARATRYVIRFRAVSDTLQVTEGLLSLARIVGTPECMGADAARFAVLSGIESGCSATRAPGTTSTLAPNHALAAQVARKVECFAADAAGDEQLAGSELSGNVTMAGPAVRELHGVMLQDLPNLKVVGRDRAHAARRLSYAAN